MKPLILLFSLFSTFLPGFQSKKTIVYISIPQVSQNVPYQKMQAHIDILGVDFKQGVLQARLSDDELNALQEIHVEYTLAPLSEQNYFINGLDGYIKPTDVAKKLQLLAKSYPNLAKTFEFGRSVDNNPLVGIEISNQQNSQNKPVVVFNALHHARELMSTEILLHMSETLLASFESDADVNRWLNSFRIVIVPQVNPDGHALVHRGYPWWRKNTAGSAVMYGVDLNRNYPVLWNGCQGSSGLRSDDTYRGPNAASEPETKAMLSLFEKYKPVANISYHTYAEAVLYPYGCKQTENPSQKLFHEIGTEIKNAIIDDEGNANTYKLGSAPDILYNADGGDNDTHWQKFGTLSFAIEAGSAKQGFQPDYNVWRDVTVKRQEGGWRALLKRMEHGVVRAAISSDQIDELSYTVSVVSPDGLQRKAFTPDAISAFRLRNSYGLLYQLVPEKSRLELNFYRSGVFLKTVPFQSNDGVINLGKIEM